LRDNKDFLGNISALAVNPRFGNYVKALLDGKMGRYFLNSGYLSLVSVVIGIVMAFVVGYFLSRYSFKGRNLIYLLFLSGMIIPTLSLLIPVFMEFKLFGILDKWYTLFLPYIAYSLPMSVILIENFIKTVPVAMDEAAQMEGCTTMDLLFKIVFPLCKPIISAVVIINFMNAWNEFPFALVLLKSDQLLTVSLGIRAFNQIYTMDYTLFMAALVVATIPVMVIYSLFCKKIIEGMTIGAVKG
jgi:ABC-type sugar transport system, permease component